MREDLVEAERMQNELTRFVLRLTLFALHETDAFFCTQQFQQ
jgi:hypothetical protein